jgi:hypothetical protein
LFLIAMRRFEEAKPELDTAAMLSAPESHEALGPAILDLYEGRFGPAATELQSATGSPWLVRALVLDGRIAEAAHCVNDADAIGAALVAAFEGQVRAEAIERDPYDAALIFAAAGQPARAIECLRRACSLRSPNVMFAAVEPLFLPLREKAEFRDLLVELRLP